VTCKAGTGEVARATPEVRSAADASPAKMSPTDVTSAAEMRAATEGMAATPEMPAATVALRESLPAGEHGGECGHGPESTFAG
jgi:hypothetical protein